jgi:hypothetical protein
LKRERADAAAAWKDKLGCQADGWREIKPMQLEGDGTMWMGKGRAAAAWEWECWDKIATRDNVLGIDYASAQKKMKCETAN